MTLLTGFTPQDRKLQEKCSLCYFAMSLNFTFFLRLIRNVVLLGFSRKTKTGKKNI